MIRSLFQQITGRPFHNLSKPDTKKLLDVPNPPASNVKNIIRLVSLVLMMTSCAMPLTRFPHDHQRSDTETRGKSNNEETGIRQGMLSVHNMIRARLGLPALRWSEQLAYIAHARAVNLAENNNCRMRHTRSKLGENLFWASAVRWSDGRTEVQKITPAHVARAWAAEAASYDYSSNSCRHGAMCGHYTQMIWRDSTELGCGMAICPDKGQIWVCVYYPPGNYVGQRPY